MTRQPTIRDVARLAGVSKATVARVVNGRAEQVRPSTASRVLEAISHLDYERNAVAGSLRTDQTHMVALCIPDITNPYWPEVARGVQDGLELHGYVVALFNSDWKPERERAYLTIAKRNRYDGLILNPTSLTAQDLSLARTPAVLLGNGADLDGIDSVASDTHQGVLLALNHLYDEGHRRIALIVGQRARGREFTRVPSYVLFHASRGITLREELLIYTSYSRAAGHEAAQGLMSLDVPPTAILAANDAIALGAIAGLRELSFDVPRDVSVVGMDDIESAVVTWPPLTTVAKPKYATGTTAAEYLVERMTEGSVKDMSARHTKLPCQLIQRGSTAPPRRRDESR